MPDNNPPQFGNDLVFKDYLKTIKELYDARYNVDLSFGTSTANYENNKDPNNKTDSTKQFFDRCGFNKFMSHIYDISLDGSTMTYYYRISLNNINKLYFTYIDDKFKCSKPLNDLQRTNLSPLNKFLYSTRVRIKNYTKSSRIFGYEPTKKNMYLSCLDTVDELSKLTKKGVIYKLENCHIDYLCKKDKKIRNVFEIKSPDGRSLKFVEDDLEFIYPNIEKIKRGFTPPKDRKIQTGSTVKVITNKKSPLPKNTQCVVKECKRIGSVDYCYIKHNDKLYYIKQKKLKKI